MPHELADRTTPEPRTTPASRIPSARRPSHLVLRTRYEVRIAPAVRLVLGIGVVAATWLLILPAIGRLPAVRAKIDAESARGINPDAMFYTDLEVMPEILRRVERRRSAASPEDRGRGFRETRHSFQRDQPDSW